MGLERVNISFPGTCDVCGGPQVWTHHCGEIYVACKVYCSPREFPIVIPPDGEIDCSELHGTQLELFETGGVDALVSGAGYEGSVQHERAKINAAARRSSGG